MCCKFSDEAVTVYPSRSMTSVDPYLVVRWSSGTRHGFPLTEQVVNSIRELLVTAKVCVLLLHPQGYSAIESELWFLRLTPE